MNFFPRRCFDFPQRKPKHQKINLNNQNGLKIKKDDKYFSNEFNNFVNTDNQHIKEASSEYIDKEIYAKFIMFLQFQEKMKKGIN